mgnify:CR=1 FL=1
MTFQTMLSRRLFTAAMLCSAALAAGAQDKYPSKPITVVVPQAAGGAKAGHLPGAQQVQAQVEA